MLGLSATHIRYLDNQRDMADELFDGCIASKMTLGEAIGRGILPTPKHVVPRGKADCGADAAAERHRYALAERAGAAAEPNV